MAKNKLFRVSGCFVLDFEKDVSAKTEAEAIRKAKYSIVKNRKLKINHFQKDTVQAWELS